MNDILLTILVTIAYVIVALLALLLILKIWVIVTRGKCTSSARLDGKTVLVTGATSGIGKVTAIDMATRGARVVLGCRNMELAEKVRAEIIKLTKNTNIAIYKLDFESLASVRNFSKQYHDKESRLDVLINNAGAGGLGNKKTEDGLDITMQVNHFGPFLLTNLLLDLLKSSAPSRIVTVASAAYLFAKLDPNDLNKSEKFLGFDYVTYSNAKLCNMLMSNELANRLQGFRVTSNCLHPGTVKTELFRRAGITVKLFGVLVQTLFKTAEQGAQTSIHLAVSEEVEGKTGGFYSDCKQYCRLPVAKNKTLATHVWDESARFVKL